MPKPNVWNNNQIATMLAVVITLAWAISFIVDILNKAYDPPASVHALMMMVAGAVFSEGLLKSRSEATRKEDKVGQDS